VRWRSKLKSTGIKISLLVFRDKQTTDNLRLIVVSDKTQTILNEIIEASASSLEAFDENAENAHLRWSKKDERSVSVSFSLGGRFLSPSFGLKSLSGAPLPRSSLLIYLQKVLLANTCRGCCRRSASGGAHRN